MDLETVLGVYFSQVATQTIFSGQRDGAIRLMIENVLTASKSPLVTSGSSESLPGMYPVALVEFSHLFESDRESGDLAKSLFDGELGAHQFQIYFLNTEGIQALTRGLTVLNRRRRATPFYFGVGRQGHVSNCFAGEHLYSLIIAREPTTIKIAAA